MTIVSHRHRLIFLKTRKTAGSSVEAWLAPHLDPEIDLAAVTADLKTLDADLAARLQPRGLKGHAEAEAVKQRVGQDVWDGYLKIAIERSPWDRMISLWRWRRHHRNLDAALDDFLDAIESGDPRRQKETGAEDWSNWPIYAIGSDIVADEVVLYHQLEQDLERTLAKAGLDFDGALPRLKSGLRSAGDRPETLTSSQVERIARLFPREIEAFGFQPPVPA